MRSAKLSTAELRELAPSIFTERPHVRLSDKYTYIPSSQIVDDMRHFGWYPVSAQEVKVKKEGWQGYQRHMVNFRHKNFLQVEGLKREVIPEIVLTNSHDGYNSFRLHAGLFRLVCTNGLMVADAMFQKFSVYHRGYDLDAVKELIESFATGVPNIVQEVSDLKKIELSSKQKISFAKDAITSRWRTAQSVPIVSPESILVPRRKHDEGNSLWLTYNVCQENLSKGGIVAKTTTNRFTKTRTIGNIKENIRVNKELWELAQKFKKKAA